jgi:hypothetical protein
LNFALKAPGNWARGKTVALALLEVFQIVAVVLLGKAQALAQAAGQIAEKKALLGAAGRWLVAAAGQSVALAAAVGQMRLAAVRVESLVQLAPTLPVARIVPARW